MTVFYGKPVKIWMRISVVVLAVVLIISAFAYNKNFSHVIDNVLGGKRAIVEDDASAIYRPDEGIVTKEDSLANGNNINIKVCEEGFVLLKNDENALPLEEGMGISVFGKNSVNLVTSGSGSAESKSAQEDKTIWDSLTLAGFVYNPMLKEFYEDNARSGEGRTANPKIETSGNVVLSTGETPVNMYEEVRSSYAQYSDAALIVISRIGGEGFDLPRTQKEDSSRHYLQLDAKEEALIEEVTSNSFGKVIVVINSANPMELDFVRENDKIDACIWIGNVGSEGIMALGRILSGEVNPSGRLTDTYPADFKKDPVWQNFGDNGIEEGDRFCYDGKNVGNYFVDYEEGIYVGYRYYETRYEEQGQEREAWYDENVVYPFGYGLSYTEFDWELQEVNGQDVSADNDIEIKVRVTNIGEAAGKDTLQVYAKAPYTTGGIEKSAKVLAAFAKTDLLEPGESQDIVLEVDPYAMSSYDYNDANNNGFCGYELEAGAYILEVALNAHESRLEVACTVKDDIRWTADTYTAEGTQIINRFEDAQGHIDGFMSRSDFEGTFPDLPTEKERTLSEEMYTSLRDTKTTLHPLGTTADVTMPALGKNNGRKLLELVGKEFDDLLWEELLDQLTVEDMVNLQLLASFCTNEIDSIGKPKTVDADGPNGFTNFMGDPTVYGTTKYCCEGVMAATFNVELIRELGRAVGNESLIGWEKENGEPYTGWYAPAMNIHRGQFGGRYCEYFSEDPYLSGMIGAYEIMGCNDMGVITYVKHLAGNEQETHRANGGNCTFTNEQALREIYLKPFEYAVKIGNTKAIMSSFNRIGTTWTGGDYRLLTEVLRNEWGFHGAVITDFNTNPSYMNTRQMAYAGGTLDLASQPHEWADQTSAADVLILRNNAHETLYAIANSNAMNHSVSGYRMAYWKLILLIVDVIAAVNCIAAGIVGIRAKYGGKKERE